MEIVTHVDETRTDRTKITRNDYNFDDMKIK